MNNKRRSNHPKKKNKNKFTHLIKENIGAIINSIKNKIEQKKIQVEQKIRRKVRKIYKKILASMTKESLYDLIDKLFVILLYNIPLCSIALNTHLFIRYRHPLYISLIMPGGVFICYSHFMRYLLFHSPAMFLYYYLVSDIILYDYYYIFHRKFKFVFLATSILDYMYTMCFEYMHFFNYSSIFSKGSVEGLMYPTAGRSFLVICLFYLWYQIFRVFQAMTLADSYIRLSQHPLLYFPRKILYSMYFWVRIVPKKIGKRGKKK